MSPAGLAKIIIFPGTQKPVPGSPNPVLSQEKRSAKTPSIVMIGGQSHVDRQFAKTIGQKENIVSVLNAGAQTISVVCELPGGYVPDPLIIFADPVIEIAGSEKQKLSTKCSIVDIKIHERSTRFKDRTDLDDCKDLVEILIQPSPAYVLNWNEGDEHSLPAVLLVKVFGGSRSAVCLVNRFHEIGMPLRIGSKGSVR